jgi:phenylacetate-CoA ligase
MGLLEKLGLGTKVEGLPTNTDRNSGLLDPRESMPPEERLAYQENFLREVVAHSYACATPLQEVMWKQGLFPHDIQSVSDLTKLPVIKKTDLVEAQKFKPPFGGFCTKPLGELKRVHRSPGPIYDPVGDVPDYYRWNTSLYAAGFRPGDLVVNTFAYHLTPAGHMFEEAILSIGGAAVPTGVGNTETQVEVIRDLGVKGYIGTPSFLNTILRRAEEMGVDPRKEFSLEVALVLAEMLPESMRSKFVQEYHILARQAYGTADVGLIAYECPHLKGMHVHHDVIVEIVNPETGAPVPKGSSGEVTVTCNNKIYPLVRFGTGDLSSLVDDPCPCGRTGPRLSKILGRVDQVTKVKGMFVHPSQVQLVLASHPEILRGRLLVERPKEDDVMTLEIEVNGEPSPGFIQAVEKTLKETAKLKGAVRAVKPGTLPEGHKTIEDARKWE